MQLCRFDNDRLGLVEGDTVRGVTAALDILPRHGYPLPRHDPLVANLAALRPQIESVAASAPRRPLAGLKLLSPIANPGKILAAPHGGGGPRGCLDRAKAAVRGGHKRPNTSAGLRDRLPKPLSASSLIGDE